ncbi:MAG TPA: CHAT domain-containing tetratricopeptide repeat protein [Blastocatellia bacterium]|nr:CHAT domain-containing tetratricopeptide repeat protein [Blastocatellia bacterium]
MLVFCLLIFNFVLVGSRAQDAQNAPSEESALRAVVESYFAAYGHKDLAGVLALWNEKSPNLAAYKQNLQQQFANEDLRFGSPAFSRIKIENEQASLRVTIAVTSINLKTKQQNDLPSIRSFEFVKEAKIWKVWRSAPAADDLAEALAKTGSPTERTTLLTEEKELVTAELGPALHAKGQRLSSQGLFDQAKVLYELILELAERGANKSTLAQAHLGLMQVYNSQAKYPQALEQCQKSLKISEELGDQAGIANAISNIGVVNWMQGNFTQALEQYQKSLKIREQIGDRAAMALSYNNIGLAYSSLANYEQALEQYQKSLKIKEGLDDKPGIAITLGNMGLVYFSLGDYAQSLDQCQKSLKIREQIGDTFGIAVLQNNIGTIYLSQGNYAQALEHYQKSLKISEERGEQFGKGIILNNIADIRQMQGHHTEALEYFQKALKIRERIGDQAGLAETLNDLGSAYEAEGEHQLAMEYFQKSLKIREQISEQAGLANTLRNIAEVYQSLNNQTQALQYAERAADLCSRIGLRNILQQSQTIAGLAYLALNQPARARQSFEAAIASIETLRTQVAGGEQERQRFFETKVSPYQAMVDLELSQKNVTGAFAYAQRLKGRTLLELLQYGLVKIDKSASPVEREQERQLSRKLVFLNRQISGEKSKPQPDQTRLTELDEELKKARLEFEAFQAALYTAHPELKVQRGELRPISLDDAATLIPNQQTAILDFIVNDGHVQLFVLTRADSGPAALNTYTIEIQSKLLAEKVERFRGRLANRDLDYQGLAQELYSLLLKPAEKQLQNKTALIISPDRSLWDLPFQVLQPQAGRYLIEDTAISYAPSLSVLREMQLARRKRKGIPPANTSILALGNPDLGKPNLTGAQFSLMGEEFRPLPEAANQVEALGRLYGPSRSRIYTGADAREEVVKEHASQYRILHLATHGILNDNNPMYSYVVLSQTPLRADEDGLLEAREITNLNLNADLVVLSACETARGRVGAGEGVIGLTWALFVAGCPTTVVSQWKVESSSTTALMLEFHKGFKTRFEALATAASTAEAMRQASLKTMRNSKYRHPFYWGGFVVVGDGN